jgi:hypothetical protein
MRGGGGAAVVASEWNFLAITAKIELDPTGTLPGIDERRRELRGLTRVDAKGGVVEARHRGDEDDVLVDRLRGRLDGRGQGYKHGRHRWRRRPLCGFLAGAIGFCEGECEFRYVPATNSDQ